MKIKSFFSFDISIIISTLMLMVFGVLFIYSSGITSTGQNLSNEYIMQIIWITTGIILFLAVVFSELHFFRRWSLYLYVLTIIALIITLFFGRKVNGARSWLGFFGFGIQPSEFAKITLMLVLADYFEKHSKSIGSLRIFMSGLLLTAVPMVLILAQPDMGTALVFIPVFTAMAFMAGVKKRYLLFLILSGVLMIILGVLPAWAKFFVKGDPGLVKILISPDILYVIMGSLMIVLLIAIIAFLSTKRNYFYWIIYFTSIFISGFAGAIGVRVVLKEYQIMRLIVFLNPYIDPKGTGWNIIQSITAVGSGGMWGRGFLEGTQSHYRFLPQQSTDFIFSILAEEWGFAGSLLVLTGFGVIIIRSIFILSKSKDPFAVLLGAGILSMLFFHVIINIGMAVGIMPITGIPLFFLSYGGSSLWTGLIAIGFLENIYMKRFSI